MGATKKKLGITDVPKAIRSDVKSLIKNAKGNFQFALVYVDDRTGKIGTAVFASPGLHGLVSQAASNYGDIRDAVRNAYRAGKESVTAAS
jgi:hypothetical protein